MSRQAEAFYADLHHHQESLRRNGITFGAARVAVRVNSDAAGPGCVYCGMCLYGCPYELIYNSAQSLARLRENPRFHYQSGIIVDTIHEQGSETLVSGRQGGDQPWHMKATRVFLGAGVLSSARILLTSLQAFERELAVQTSQHFLLPLLRYHTTPGVSSEQLHTLCQIFLEYQDHCDPRKDVHLQIYAYNDFYVQALKKLIGPLYRPLRGLIEDQFLGRLLIAQGYLHSDFSPTLTLRLNESSKRIQVTAKTHPTSRKRIQFLTAALRRHASELKAWPLDIALKLSRPGVGAHIGGSFPMRRHPGPFETDILGIPSGYRRLHLIDASTFPDIPPTTITLTIMANAHRIASRALGMSK